MSAPTAADALVAHATINFDSRVHQLIAVKKALYRFLDRLTANVIQDGDAWVCDLTFTQPIIQRTADELILDLQREVLDQGLRETIAAETAAVRNAVLGLAFSNTGLQSIE